MTTGQSPVMVDVLVRAEANEGSTPSRPSSERVEQVRRWFAARNVILHATPFGTSGSVSPDDLARSLGIPTADLHSTGDLPVPEELDAVVEQITIAPPPDLF